MATPDSVIQVSWAGKLYKSGLGQVCAICGDKNVAMLYVRAVRDVRAKITINKTTYQEWLGAYKRKQIPLCGAHHEAYHAGEREEIKIISSYQ